MKACIGLLLLAVMFQVSTTRGNAQAPPDSFPVWSGYIPDVPERPLVPASVANPRFPLEAKIVSGHWAYNGNHEYKGYGTVMVLGQTNQSLSYKYRCVNSFRGSGMTYEARWVKPGQTLEILMGKPNSNRTESCTLSTRS